jgi:sulfur-oxidizing protein SoxA
MRSGVAALRRLTVMAVLALPAMAADESDSARRSGYEFMGSGPRAMQDDDAANPGMLWVLEGEALWQRKAGTADKSCADCHGEAAAGMKGVAARYPAYDAALQRPINLEQRINRCRSERQQAPALKYESKDLLALTAYVGRQSRGLPIEIAEDARLEPFIDAGRAAFTRRMGQLNLSCAHCHELNSGKKLAGNPVTEAHPNGYPLYRLEWQGVGSLSRRLRNCMIGTRRQLAEFGSPELVELELYLMWRARGMKLETPAVRP